MTLPVLPLQEIGSLAKPVWRIQALSGKTVAPAAFKEAEKLVKELRPANGDRLLALLRKTGLDAGEKQEIKEFCSALAIGWQEKVGLDLVYDGEQHRTEMYDFAVKHIKNFEPRGYVRSFDNRYYLKQAVVGPPSPTENYHLDELRIIKKYATKPVKIPITGAYTLMDWSFDEHYIGKVKQGVRRRREALDEARRHFGIDLAQKVLRPNIKALVEAGAHSIQIDEPAAITRPDEMDLVVDTFNESVKGLKGRFTIHICFSDYRLMWPAVTKLENCAQFTLEYANKDSQTPGVAEGERPGYETIKLFKENKTDFEVGVGVLDVHTDTFETPELVRDRILYAVKARGDASKVYINPDCGLRTRTWDVSRQKMEIMAKGTELARKQLKTTRR
jgi:5-methyltetrahydropteroyltriglutamate--homocysteine methyltransferase